MKTAARIFAAAFLTALTAGCIFKKPTQDNDYDVNCGGVTIESAASCFKLEVMEVVAVAPGSYTTGTQTQQITYYFKTTDNCYRDKNGLAQSGAVQTGGSVCSLIPNAKFTAILQAVQVRFAASCPTQFNAPDAAGNLQTIATPTNGACNVTLNAGTGYKGKSLTAIAVATVNIGISQINGGNPMDVRVSDRVTCDANIPIIYGSSTLILYTDSSTTAMPATGSWSYTGSGGSVDTAGVFTPSGTNGNFTGTVTYTGVTTKNISVTLTFPITISDGVYVSVGGTGNGCLNKPYGTVQAAIPLADALFPKRTVYVSGGSYTFDSQDSTLNSGSGTTPGGGSIIMREGVSVRGGYATTFIGPTAQGYLTSCPAPPGNASCLIDNTAQAGLGSNPNRAVTFVSGMTSATSIEGFFIAGTSSAPIGGASINAAIFGNAGTPTIRNNSIFGGAPASATGSLDISGIYLSSGADIKNNYIIGGRVPGNAASATIQGIYSIDGANGFITNNVIDAGSNPGRITAYALNLSNGCHPILTNNTLVSAWGSAIYMPDYGGSVSASNSTITNNIIAWGGTGGSFALHEAHIKGAPRSVENNAFFPLTATATMIYSVNSSTSVTALEAYASWIGGSDKARGNILLPTAGKPFINFPRSIDSTNGAGTTTSFATANFALYADLDYIEFNGDGTPHQITGCGGTCAASPISFTTPLAVASTTRMEIRNWKTNNKPQATSYNFSYNINLQAMANMPVADYNNLRYGGKDTSGNVCGAPSGGPGVGPGGESCGQITTDFRSPGTRTLGWSGGQDPTNTNNGGVPSGYAIGANEAP